jgi:hypothetical protein
MQKISSKAILFLHDKDLCVFFAMIEFIFK